MRSDTVIGGSGQLTGKVSGSKGVSGIPAGVQDGQRKPPKESGFPGMMDVRPQESDVTKSAGS